MHLSDVKAIALSLPDAERGELAATLIDSLDLPDPKDWDKEGVAEAVRRSEELNAGSVRAIPERDFWRQVQADRV